MEENNQIKISLKAVLLIIFIILIVIAILLKILISSNKEVNYLASEKNETVTNEITEDIEYLDEKDITEYLSFFAYFNSRYDNNKSTEDIDKIKVTIVTHFIDYHYDENERLAYNRTDVSEALNEMFNEDMNNIISSGINDLIYDEAEDCYVYQYGGDATCSAYVLKIENQSYSDGIYTITFLYAYISDSDLIDNTIDDYDYYRTSVDIKVNQDYKYSKYQLVNIDSITSTKVGKIKDLEDIVDYYSE